MPSARTHGKDKTDKKGLCRFNCLGVISWLECRAVGHETMNLMDSILY